MQKKNPGAVHPGVLPFRVLSLSYLFGVLSRKRLPLMLPLAVIV